MISDNINDEDNVNSEKLDKELGNYKGILKWGESVVGVITHKNEVNFIKPNLNPVVSLYTNGSRKWTSGDFKEFLKDRVFSKNRKDIEKILTRCGLVEYDVFDIGFATRAFNAKDSFWISKDYFEKMKYVIGDSFSNIFSKPLDELGDSAYSPDGVNVKFYGVHEEDYGLYKLRLHQYSTDSESEVAVYNLSKLMRVNCCEARIVKKKFGVGKRRKIEDISFSKFEYDFTKESIIHARRFVKEEYRVLFNNNEYQMLKHIFPKFKADIAKMILIDFVTRQTDRHLSNFAIKISDEGIRDFYPLYDNGRSLFHEDKEEFINDALKDIRSYSSEFGSVGTYYDYVEEVAQDFKISELVNLDISKDEIYNAYQQSGITEERLSGAVSWTFECLQILKELDNQLVIE